MPDYIFNDVEREITDQYIGSYKESIQQTKETRETWAAVLGYEGLYQVSTYGRIKALPRVLTRSKSGKCYISEERFLTQSNRNGYKVVTLRGKGKPETKLVHRLVAQAFLPNPENKPEVNHIDNNPGNPKLNNLEWVTKEENAAHSILQGRRSVKFKTLYKYL